MRIIQFEMRPSRVNTAAVHCPLRSQQHATEPNRRLLNPPTIVKDYNFHKIRFNIITSCMHTSN